MKKFTLLLSILSLLFILLCCNKEEDSFGRDIGKEVTDQVADKDKDKDKDKWQPKVQEATELKLVEKSKIMVPEAGIRTVISIKKIMECLLKISQGQT